MLLCGLVYFFSYDHGRRSISPQFENYKIEAAALLNDQRLEILNLHAALAGCQAQVTPDSASADRLALRINQSRLLFNGRVVLTLLRVDSADSKALVQLNFIEEGCLVQEELQAGGSLRFTQDGSSWAVVVSSLALSSANFNLVELKEI